MKKMLLAIALLCSMLSFSQEWKSFEEAKVLAQKENKNIILVFSGSDWCAPCIKLDKNIWQSEEFKAEAAKKWILVKADFPKKKGNALPQNVQDANKELAEKYNKEGYFPLVVIMDKNAKVTGKTGFKNVSPAEYITLLHSLEKK
jgi:thioredoxin-related protein